MEKKYNNADSCLHRINKSFVTLNENDIKEFNVHFNKIINFLCQKMRECDQLFNKVYRKIAYCGSYYDGLKVHKPHEYDLNIVLKLPYNYTNIQLSSDCEPGFLQIIIPNYPNEINEKSKDWNLYKTVNKWIINNKLSKKAINHWMQSVITKAFNGMGEFLQVDNFQYSVKFRVHNPAITLNCKCMNKPDIWFDVDLVPVIEFDTPMWPPPPFRKNDCTLQESWYAVPKSKSKQEHASSDFNWRLSFQVQERRLIKNINHLKPVVRLLKKLRDTQDFQIASYYIKTIILWEIENQPSTFWSNSLSYIFMHMLQKFKSYMEKKKIPFYWHKGNNLVSPIHVDHLGHIARQLTKMIDNIDNKVKTDGNIIMSYILTPDERKDFENNKLISLPEETPGRYCLLQ